MKKLPEQLIFTALLALAAPAAHAAVVATGPQVIELAREVLPRPGHQIGDLGVNQCGLTVSYGASPRSVTVAIEIHGKVLSCAIAATQLNLRAESTPSSLRFGSPPDTEAQGERAGGCSIGLEHTRPDAISVRNTATGESALCVLFP